MSCLNPIWMYDTGKLSANGKRVLTPKCNPRLPVQRLGFPVPCGKCAECKRARVRQWVARARLEAFSSSAASFVTLTYADNPDVLDKSHVQKFLKRLRHASRDFGVPPFSLRYFVAGEYGFKNSRPHWHGILFGVDMLSPPWLPHMVLLKDGFPIYSSSILEKIWSHGFVTVDRANDANIKYVSKYILKDGSCALHSQGLGRSPFVRVMRRGRSSDYLLRPLFYDSVSSGSIMLPDKFGLSPIGIPKDFDRYLERCDKPLYDLIRQRRSDYVSKLPFDRYQSGEVLSISNYADKLEKTKRGILHEKTTLLHP